MSKKLLDLSGKTSSALIEVFDTVAGVAAATHICYFVVGATARDVILSHGHGIAIRRAPRAGKIVQAPSAAGQVALRMGVPWRFRMFILPPCSRVRHRAGLAFDPIPSGIRPGRRSHARLCGKESTLRFGWRRKPMPLRGMPSACRFLLPTLRN